MNSKRIALAAVAALIADLAFGYLYYTTASSSLTNTIPTPAFTVRAKP